MLPSFFGGDRFLIAKKNICWNIRTRTPETDHCFLEISRFRSADLKQCVKEGLTACRFSGRIFLFISNHFRKCKNHLCIVKTCLLHKKTSIDDIATCYAWDASKSRLSTKKPNFINDQGRIQAGGITAFESLPPLNFCPTRKKVTKILYTHFL